MLIIVVGDVDIGQDAFLTSVPRSPLELRNKWFVNLSTQQIPTVVQGLLQLGANFCMSIMRKIDNLVTHFIKYLENSIRFYRLTREIQLEIVSHL